MAKRRSHISVVVPVYNEEKGVASFHNTLLMPVLDSEVKYTFSIVYVDDGSTDKSLAELHSVAKKDKRISVVALSRNFGKEIATSAGIAYATGEATIILDADGQHPPKYIPEIIRLWEEGNQVVTGVRTNDQHEGAIKRIGSKVFYKLYNKLVHVRVTPRSTDFRLIDQAVRTMFLQCQERDRMTRGLIDWLGFKSATVSFSAPPRADDKASYTVKKLFLLAITSFTSFSLKPLFISAILGSIITLLSFVAGLFVIIEQLILKDPLHLNITGSAMLGIFVSFLVGIVLTTQGIVAIYISHIYNQTQGRPLFVVNPNDSRNIVR